MNRLPSIDTLRQNHRSIGFFGLGFIQIKTSPVERYHFYDPTIQQTVSPESIHNHRYNFKSEILAGILRQEIFAKASDDQSYLMREESCQPGIVAEDARVETGVRLTSSQEFAAGSSYELDYRTFHRVSAVGRTITRITRELGYRQLAAQVIEPADTVRVCPFESSYSEEELWEKVGEMLT